MKSKATFYEETVSYNQQSQSKEDKVFQHDLTIRHRYLIGVSKTDLKPALKPP
jgi:hypothetical protein